MCLIPADLRVILIIAVIFTSVSFSQSVNRFGSDLKLKEKKPSFEKITEGLKSDNNVTVVNAPFKKSEVFEGLLFYIPLMLINPILVFEDKKIFWGLTKEISFSIFPLGRLTFEYSFLFRTFNKNHLRFSYNYDFIYKKDRDFVGYAISPGAGYFTDTKNKGVFGQCSFGFLVPTPVLIIDLYIKYRYTRIYNENKSDIHDVSIGSGLIF